MRPSPDSDPIPRFFLYGEAPRDAGDRFLHIESIAHRSLPSEWTIRPHRHAALHHIFLIEHGGGTLRVDEAALRFGAPALLLIPAGGVHGFDFVPGTQGEVVTLAEDFLAETCARFPALASVFAAPAALPLGHDAPIRALLDSLRQELAWSAPGHEAALESLMTALLVSAFRLNHAVAAAPAAPNADSALVARFRARIEDGFRLDRPLDHYAALLGVSEVRLRRACRAVAEDTPARLVENRRMLEARRLLRYGTMRIAEIAYAIGYDDPAYFARRFRQVTGAPPREWRERI